jgi:cytochrome c-type biogenesis protein CcmH/NrfG
MYKEDFAEMTKHQLKHTLFVAGAVVALAGLALFVVTDRQDTEVIQGEASQTTQDRSASVGSLVGGLEARLAENPGDAKGWLLLARSHDHLGNNAKAWNAYSRARDLGMSDEALELKLAANMVGALDQ